MQGTAATDSQLLDYFVRERDSTAFRSLVIRHGPSVLQICRGVLHDRHAAEDAFQATFLVLVRKAPSIQDPEALGGWLRGVAYRTALRARSDAARRRVIERTRADMSPIAQFQQEPTPELRQTIREELNRLPDCYREPLTLCYMEGMTNQEAASQLGWPIGTVKVRLVRGRRLLRERLDRRGAGFGAALLVWLLNARPAPAVPERLVEGTVRVMTLGAAGRRKTLESQFADMLRMADAELGLGTALKIHWSWPVIVLSLIMVGLTGSAAFAWHGKPVPDVDPTTLPANLTDILNIDCG